MTARFLAALELVRATDQHRELRAVGRDTLEDAARVLRARCRFEGVPVPREFNRWGNR